jgi:integrase
MAYVFKSVFAEEIAQYITLRVEVGRHVGKTQSNLKSLDIYLIEHGLTDKNIDEGIISSWLASRDVKTQTKKKLLSDVRMFSKYLCSLGYAVSLPDDPIAHSDYAPYIFSEEELCRIFSAADNFRANSNKVESAFQFPIVLRVLYSCGLRLREALTMEWCNYDIAEGVIKIIAAKNDIQRSVPVSGSVKTMLRQYKELTETLGICDRYVFESWLNPDEPYANVTFWGWFSKILAAAEVKYARRTIHERGPCAHCLRHLFTVRSFLKLEEDGKAFDDAVPFVSAYLGHRGLMETERYLRAEHIMYTQSHQRVADHIGDVFPEVIFE